MKIKYKLHIKYSYNGEETLVFIPKTFKSVKKAINWCNDNIDLYKPKPYYKSIGYFIQLVEIKYESFGSSKFYHSL